MVKIDLFLFPQALPFSALWEKRLILFLPGPPTKTTTISLPCLHYHGFRHAAFGLQLLPVAMSTVNLTLCAIHW